MPVAAPTLYRYHHEEMTTDIRGPATGACPGSSHEGVDAMGRGRQKAKQTKVARRLKYYSPETDYSALQRELSGSERSGNHAADDVHEDDAGEDLDDDYADYADDDDEDDDEDDAADGSGGRWSARR
jgi:hypothetical protein